MIADTIVAEWASPGRSRMNDRSILIVVTGICLSRESDE